MSAYLIASYDVSDPTTYAKYNPGSLGLIMETVGRHGGTVLAAGTDHHWMAGDRHALVMIEFPSVDAAKAWEADPDYATVKSLRLESTSNRFEVISPKFQPPG